MSMDGLKSFALIFEPYDGDFRGVVGSVFIEAADGEEEILVGVAGEFFSCGAVEERGI